MADRHNKKVGNKGDVWKHFILCCVAEKLIRGHDGSKPFVYADSHCSAGYFPLPENGQWQQGIGMFYGKKWELAGRPYFVTEQDVYETHKAYLGSWKLVAALLASSGIAGDLRLFDTSESVAQQLSGVRGYSQSDGFAGIMNLPGGDLYMIDPAYSEHRESDWRRARKVSQELLKRNAAALIWYPLFVKDRSFVDLPGAVVAEVKWPAIGANQLMRGCGIVGLGVASSILSGLQSPLAQLAVAFTGTLSLRDNRG